VINMAQASDYYLQLNDDGTPRRKHDIEEREARRPIFFSIAGFVFFNAFALLKTIWFGDSSARAESHGRGGSGSQDIPQIVADAAGETGAVADSAPADDEASDPGVPDALPAADYVRGSGLKFSLTSLDLNFSDTGAIATARLGAPLATASNDNITLYGAAPGRAIVLQDGAATGSSGGADAGSSQISPFENDDAGDSPDEDTSQGSGSGPGSGGGSSGSGGSSSDPRGNRLPVVSNVVILSTLLINEARSFELSDFLQNASDADGDSLDVVNVKASAGHVVAKADGGWLYIPEFNDRSVVEFTYDIKDGQGSVAQKAYISLVAGVHVPLSGTDGDDDLASQPIDELIAHIVDAGAGDDRVRTGSGDDVVYGSSGDDVISTGAGNDVVYAGDGNDVVDAGSGDDYVAGENGDDEIKGGMGNDRLEGGDGDDVLFGGDGDDALTGGAGHDEIDGGEGNDTIFGEAGDGADVMSGGAGDDAYIAHTADGDDEFSGGEGNDVYRSAVDDGKDIVHGGEGHDIYIAVEVGGGDTFHGDGGCDTYDASEVENAVIIDLASGAVYHITDVDVVREGEESISAAASPEGSGSSSQDPLADSGSLALTTDNTVSATEDSLDEVSAAAASGEPGVPSLYQPASTAIPDILIDVENAVGGQGDDIIIAGDGVNELTGGEGDDTFVFQTVASSGSGKGSRDKILDFEVGDRINIDDISEEFENDFNEVFDDPGIRKFMLIAQGQEFARPGEIRFKYDEEHGATVLEGNIDFDADTDFEIEILGTHQLRYDSYVYST
jgi:Ca2+-binding RTX toxin-like protein